MKASAGLDNILNFLQLIFYL